MSTKYTIERTQAAPTEESLKSFDQLSRPAQCRSIPPISPTRERLIRTM